MSSERYNIRKFLMGETEVVDSENLSNILSEVAIKMIKEGLSEEDYYYEIQEIAERAYNTSKKKLIYEEVIRRVQR
tara:strand:+ start:40 stop:267 length:228 start_codon:yes stop_codon:yes gene_type:complete